MTITASAKYQMMYVSPTPSSRPRRRLYPDDMQTSRYSLHFIFQSLSDSGDPGLFDFPHARRLPAMMQTGDSGDGLIRPSDNYLLYPSLSGEQASLERCGLVEWSVADCEFQRFEEVDYFCEVIAGRLRP